MQWATKHYFRILIKSFQRHLNLCQQFTNRWCDNWCVCRKASNCCPRSGKHAPRL